MTPVRKIYIDPEPTSPSIFTKTKTTRRSVYNVARARVNLSPMPTPADAHLDILLHNQNGFAMETSIRNIAFWRDQRWVTPSLATGCLSGVMRRVLLQEFGVLEQDTKIDNVLLGEVVLIFNGVDGMQYAEVVSLSIPR